MNEEEVRTYPVNQDTAASEITISVPWVQRQASGAVIARVHVTSPKHMAGELLLTEQDLTALDADERPLRTQVRRFWGYTALKDVTPAHEHTARFDVGFRVDLAATRGRCALSVAIVRTFRLGEGPRAVGGPWFLKFRIADDDEVTTALRAEATRQEASQREAAAREAARLERLRQEAARQDAARQEQLRQERLGSVRLPEPQEPPRPEPHAAPEEEPEAAGAEPARAASEEERPAAPVQAIRTRGRARFLRRDDYLRPLRPESVLPPSDRSDQTPEPASELATDAILGPVKTAQEDVDAGQTAVGDVSAEGAAVMTDRTEAASSDQRTPRTRASRSSTRRPRRPAGSDTGQSEGAPGPETGGEPQES